MNSIVTFPNRIPVREFEERRFKVFTDRQLDKIEAIQNLPEDTLFEMKVVASVLPVRSPLACSRKTCPASPGLFEPFAAVTTTRPSRTLT